MSALMSMHGLDRLSLAERLQLVEELWESIAREDKDWTLSEAQQRDLAARLAAYRNDPQAGSPWEQVKDRLERKTS